MAKPGIPDHHTGTPSGKMVNMCAGFLAFRGVALWDFCLKREVWKSWELSGFMRDKEKRPSHQRYLTWLVRWGLRGHRHKA